METVGTGRSILEALAIILVRSSGTENSRGVREAWRPWARADSFYSALAIILVRSSGTENPIVE